LPSAPPNVKFTDFHEPRLVANNVSELGRVGHE
jgi:hypothetical protein